VPSDAPQSDSVPGSVPLPERVNFEEWADRDDRSVAETLEWVITPWGRFIPKGTVITPRMARELRVRFRYTDAPPPVERASHHVRGGGN
jgi:hypothetical protein